MDSDDEVVGASYKAGKPFTEALQKPDSTTLERESILPTQAPEMEKGGSEAEKAGSLSVIWARVKGFPPWPVSFVLSPSAAILSFAFHSKSFACLLPLNL